MKTVNIREARARLSQLVNQAASGEPFIITRAGRPVVCLFTYDGPKPQEGHCRLGFLRDQFDVPADFDHMGHDTISDMFGQ